MNRLAGHERRQAVSKQKSKNTKNSEKGKKKKGIQVYKHHENT